MRLKAFWKLLPLFLRPPFGSDRRVALWFIFLLLIVLTWPLGGAPRLQPGQVAVLASQEGEAEGGAVGHVQQGIASRRPSVDGAAQRVVDIDVSGGARQRLAGHGIPDQNLQSELGTCTENQWAGEGREWKEPISCVGLMLPAEKWKTNHTATLLSLDHHLSDVTQ